MVCIAPLTIKHDGKSNVVRCGKCGNCRQARRADWTFRLLQEWNVSHSSHFLTFTYDDSNLPIDNDGNGLLVKSDIQRLNKRIRKANRQYVAWPVRFYAVGEYGSLFGRPHYHQIMFNLVDEVVSGLDKLWPLGFVHIGSVTMGSIHYCSKYHVDNGAGYGGDRAPPFALMSRRPGIGVNYIHSHATWHRDGFRNYTAINGNKFRIPRYYKEKMFSDQEREFLGSVALLEAQQEYDKEIDRLSRLHDDPVSHYVERVKWASDNVKAKSNFF